MNSYLILFDGICNLCNGWVQFIIKHDKKKQFRFGALQSEAAQNILKVQSLHNINSVVLIMNGKAYTQSSAVLEIFRLLGFPWKLLYVFKILPPVIRNFLYNLLARYRYKWFAKRDSCMMPDDKLKERFID